jgi:hypothetical protein
MKNVHFPVRFSAENHIFDPGQNGIIGEILKLILPLELVQRMICCSSRHPAID